jgi:hypothetical protein
MRSFHFQGESPDQSVRLLSIKQSLILSFFPKAPSEKNLDISRTLGEYFLMSFSSKERLFIDLLEENDSDSDDSDCDEVIGMTNPTAVFDKTGYHITYIFKDTVNHASLKSFYEQLGNLSNLSTFINNDSFQNNIKMLNEEKKSLPKKRIEEYKIQTSNPISIPNKNQTIEKNNNKRNNFFPPERKPFLVESTKIKSIKASRSL